MSPSRQDRFSGCLLGLALGDALGAPHEGGVLERLLWRVIGRTRDGRRRFTDDTQMSLDLVRVLIERGEVDQDLLARRFAESYRFSRGYGPGAARLLKRIRRGEDWRVANRAVFPEGSWGNGGAMRAPVLGLFYASDRTALREAVKLATEVTHAHPLAIEGARLVAVATALALEDRSVEGRLEELEGELESEVFLGRFRIAREWISEGVEPGPKEVARRLGRGIAASDSCVTAVYLALAHPEKELGHLLELAKSLGGDVDTIAAMSCSIHGSRGIGSIGLPRDLLRSVEASEVIEELSRALSHREPA